MVSNIMSLSRSGLADWFLQRATAVILGVYTLGLLAYLLANPDLDYAQWRGLFTADWMRIASLLTLISICVHAWIGMWTVATDYLTAQHLGRAATSIRLLFQSACIIVIFIYLVWGIQILWGS